LTGIIFRLVAIVACEARKILLKKITGSHGRTKRARQSGHDRQDRTVKTSNQGQPGHGNRGRTAETAESKQLPAGRPEHDGTDRTTAAEQPGGRPDRSIVQTYPGQVSQTRKISIYKKVNVSQPNYRNYN
jgi:hypothetical protein